MFLQRAVLSNAFVQYRVRHAKRRKCGWLRGDELWCYLRGYDAALEMDGDDGDIDDDNARPQIDVQETGSICHQQWNQATHNVLNHVLTFDERKFVILNVIKNSHMCVVKSVDSLTDEFSLVLPSGIDRTEEIEL